MKKEKQTRTLSENICRLGIAFGVIFCGFSIELVVLWQRNLLTGRNILWFLMIFAFSVLVLAALFVQWVYSPLSKVEHALEAMEHGGELSEMTLSEHDVSLLSRTMGQAITELKKSMDREYAAGILKKQAELDALQSQINPHFLYNTLESIRGNALVEGMDEIAEMTEALSIFFRYSISYRDNIVTLANELENVKNYFKIQQYRFNNRFALDVILSDENDILVCRMPKLTLQPIVENAIYHGLEGKMGQGHITIRVVSTQSRVIIVVSDDGIGMDKEKLAKIQHKLWGETEDEDENENGEKRRSGIAISNVNQRIALMFGEEYGVSISSTPGVGTDVTLTLPLLRKS